MPKLSECARHTIIIQEDTDDYSLEKQCDWVCPKCGKVLHIKAIRRIRDEALKEEKDG